MRWPAKTLTWSRSVTGATSGSASCFGTHRFGGNEPARLAIVVGFLGGYTTFSSYTLEGLGLIERGRPLLAAVYLGGSVLSGLVAGGVGLALGRSLASRL